MSFQKTIYDAKKQQQKEKLLSVLLPILLLISFIWLNLYTTMTNINASVIYSRPKNAFMLMLVFDVLLKGLFDYLVFELLFFLYRFFIGFSIYSFMIPKQVLKNKFRFWYIFRNLILGLIFNIRFFVPYFAIYSCVFEILMDMILLVCLYFDLNREYVEPLVGQFVFKTLAIPFMLYETMKVVLLMWGVL